MNTQDPETVREAVRDRYAGHARTMTSCCSTSACCGSDAASTAVAGYAPEDLANLPGDADLGLGCGNPLAMESIREGETVVDLGSGGGIDCFLAARRVGPNGHVIGVDMTPEMVLLAKRNAEKGDFGNVEFRLGEIEDLPVESDAADLIISNCVINLVPNKARAFAEAFRILKPKGRVSVSDIVTTAPLPSVVAESVGAYVACLGGASVLDDYLAAMSDAGFVDIRIVSNVGYSMDADEVEEFVGSFSADLGMSGDELAQTAGLFRSVTVQASKPL